MTRGDLIRHCGLELGLDRTASSDEQLLMVDWANEGVRDVLLSTHCRVEIGDQILTIGVADYRVDANIMAVDERTITANTFPMGLVTPAEMYELRRSTSAAGSSVMRIAVEGDLLMVWPAPTAATTIRYIYVAKPTEMTSDAHDPSNVTYGGLPIYAHHGVLQYMLWRGARYDERRAPHTPNDYHTFYMQECAQIRKRARRMAGHANPGLRVGYPGISGAGTRNDIYPAA